MDARDNSHPRTNLDAYRFSDDVQLCNSDGCSSIMQNLPRCSGSAQPSTKSSEDTRVSERSNRSNTTGDDQSTPGGFSQRATDGAAPEEKPAEAYIKLTNASLRDQNPDEDEEEDEYYKWKAAKANQVAPEP